MDVEIRTTTDIWITRVTNQELVDPGSGAAARSVGDRIKAGEPIEVRAEISGEPAHAARSLHIAVFNPGHVVAVLEKGRPRRQW